MSHKEPGLQHPRCSEHLCATFLGCPLPVSVRHGHAPCSPPQEFQHLEGSLQVVVVAVAPCSQMQACLGSE